MATRTRADDARASRTSGRLSVPAIADLAPDDANLVVAPCVRATGADGFSPVVQRPKYGNDGDSRCARPASVSILPAASDGRRASRAFGASDDGRPVSGPYARPAPRWSRRDRREP